MASMKTMMMIALDVAPSMGDAVDIHDPNNPLTKLQLAKSFLSLFILQRAIASKTAEFGLAAFGYDETSNYLNSSQGGYEGIVEIAAMERPSRLTLEELNKVEVGTEQVDLIDAVVVSQDVLMRVNAGKAFNRILLLITDGETPVEGVDDLEVIVEQMKTIKNFGLYIAMLSKVTESSSVVKKENAKLLQSLAESAGGRFMEVGDLSDATHLLSGGLGLGTRPTLSKLLLEVTPNLKIPCVHWSKVSKATAPSLKKQPKPERGGEEGGGDPVKRDLSYRHPDNEELEIGAEERVKGFRYGAQFIPVTPADEENFKIPGPALMKILGFYPKNKIPRHHFLDSASYLHPALDSESAHYAFSSFALSLLKEEKIALARLVKRENSDPALIALLPTMTGEGEGEEGGGGGMVSFLFYRIPFVDDIREYNFPSLIAFASEKTVRSNEQLIRQRETMGHFIDSLTIPHYTKSDTTPSNGNLRNIYATLHAHLLNLREEEKVVVPDYQCLTRLPEKLPIIAGVYESFPLEKVEKKSKRKKVFWSDVNGGEAVVGGEVTGGDAKRAKIEIDVTQIAAAINTNTATNTMPKPVAATAGRPMVAPASIGASQTQSSSSSQSQATAPASAAAPVAVKQEEEEEEEDDLNLPEFTVGTATPVEDCQALIDAIRAMNPPNKKKRIQNALTILTKVIQRNINLGGSRTHYKRAVACLVLFRSVSIEEKDVEQFNEYLQNFKKTFQKGRHALAWQLATDQLITLISKSEVKASKVTDDDAEQFLADIDNEGREDEEEDEGAV